LKRNQESLKLREFIKRRRIDPSNEKWITVFNSVLTELETRSHSNNSKQIVVYRKPQTDKSNEKYWSYYFRGYNNRHCWNNKPLKNRKILKMEHKWNQHY